MTDGAASTPRFLFDENIPHAIAAGFKAFGENVTSVQATYGRGDVPDEELLTDVGKGSLTFVSRDLRNRRRPAEVAIIKEHRVGGFWLTGKDLSAWQMIQQLVRHWPEIKRLAAETRRPFVFMIRPNGRIEPYQL